MILDDIADRAGFIIKSSATLDTEIFCHGYLHTLDVVAVPECLHERICEAEGDYIIHRLLAQIVVDPEDSCFIELSQNDFIEVLRRRQVMPERLLNNDPGPGRAAAMF